MKNKVMKKFRIFYNNGQLHEDVESDQTLEKLRFDLNNGLWLLIGRKLISPRVITEIVEVDKE